MNTFQKGMQTRLRLPSMVCVLCANLVFYTDGTFVLLTCVQQKPRWNKYYRLTQVMRQDPILPDILSDPGQLQPIPVSPGPVMSCFQQCFTLDCRREHFTPFRTSKCLEYRAMFGFACTMCLAFVGKRKG